MFSGYFAGGIFMRHTFIMATVLGLSSAVAAQAQQQALPAEFPPASYTGNQYIDSNGCAFIRAGISGVVNWIPRMNRQREQLCGFQPSLSASVVDAGPVITADAPLVIVPPVAEVAMADDVTGDDAMMADEGMAPIATVAGSGFVPVRSPVVVQPPVVVPVVAPVVAAVPPRRVTLAAICAEIAASGETFINQATGLPVVCPSAVPAPVVAAAAPARTGVFTRRIPASNPVGLTAADVVPTPGYRDVWTDGRINPNRGLPPSS